MRIVQINAIYGVGSTGRLCRDIHLELQERSHESYVFTPLIGSAADADPGVRRIGSKADHKMHALLRRVFKDQGFHSSVATLRLCRALKKIDPDVVHLHNLHSNYINLDILLSFLGKRNIPTLLTIHDTWFFTGYCTHFINRHCSQWKTGCGDCPAVGKLFRRTVRKLYEKKKRLFESIPSLYVNGVSKWTADIAKESFLGSAKEVLYIYNWTAPPRVDGLLPKDAIYSKYGIDPQKKLIVGVAQSWEGAEAKGFRDFVALAGQVKEHAEILLVGAYNHNTRIDGITFTGYVRDEVLLSSLYAAADVFVSPSKAETFGLTMAEALSYGTPVVAYDNTGARELVGENCGVLVEDGNTDLLIRAVEDVMQSGKARFAKDCVASYCQCFEKNNQLNKYMCLYEEISKKEAVIA